MQHLQFAFVIIQLINFYELTRAVTGVKLHITANLRYQDLELTLTLPTSEDAFSCLKGLKGCKGHGELVSFTLGVAREKISVVS